jgi:hypothetical protein
LWEGSPRRLEVGERHLVAPAARAEVGEHAGRSPGSPRLETTRTASLVAGRVAETVTTQRDPPDGGEAVARVLDDDRRRA